MKISKLLVLGALFAVSVGSAKADVPDGPWVMPEPQGLEFTDLTFDDGVRYVFYSPAAKMFFASANDWNTRASICTFGNPFWFTTEESCVDGQSRTAPEGYYFLNDDVVNPNRQMTNKDLFTDGGGSTWCDRNPSDGSQVEFYWTAVKVGDSWRIQNKAYAEAGQFIGWKGDYNDSRLYMITEAEGAIDWKVVTEDSYQSSVGEYADPDVKTAYENGVNTYIAALNLRAVLVGADTLGVSIVSASQVYTNLESTIDDLNAAKDLLNARIALKKALTPAQEAGVYTADAEAILADESSEQKAVTDATNLLNARVNLKKAIDAAKEVYIDVTNAEAVLADNSKNAEQLSNATDALKPLTDAKKALKDLIEECEAAGYDQTADAKAVLQNTAAKILEVQTAYDALSAAYTEWGKTHATVENPGDMTGMIANPNFDNASYEGWKGTAPNMTGSGSHGPANVAEKWNDTFDTYQDIEGLPQGFYTLSAKTSWRGSWKDMESNIGPAAKLYAQSGDVEKTTPFNYIWACYNTTPMAGTTYFGPSAGENSETHDGVTYYSPNDPSAFRLYEEAGFYDTSLMIKVGEDGKMRIGVKNPEKLGDADNWSCFDTFKLLFLGDGADAWKIYLDENWGNFAEVEIPEGTLVTQQYIDAYQEAQNVDITKLTTKEEIKGAMEGVENAYAALQKNIELWKKYQEDCEKAYNNYAQNQDYTVSDESIAKAEADGNMDLKEKLETLRNLVGALADYYELDENPEGGPGMETILGEVSLTNEQLQAEIQWLEETMAAVEKAAIETIVEGADVTRFLKNPGFEYGLSGGKAEGWTVDVNNNSQNGNITPGPLGTENDQKLIDAIGTTNHAFESWHVWDFDVWQQVPSAREGVYTIEVQGYVRCEESGYTKGDEIDPARVPIKLYMNSAISSFPSVYSEDIPDEKYLTEDITASNSLPVIEDWSWETVNGKKYPNSMGGASLCFAWDMYKVQTFGLVKEGEPLRIGVKGSMNSNWWCIWDDFKLTFWGYDMDHLMPALQDALLKIKSDQPMATSVKAKAQALETKAADAVASGAGKTVFDMLAEIYDIVGEIEASVNLFAELNAAMESLNEAIATSEADQGTIDAANDLLVNVANTYKDGENEDVPVLKAEIETMIARLKVPANWVDGSDDNPADLTGVIKTPSFVNEDDYSNSSAGWTNPGNLGNDDTQKSAYAMEFWQIAFDMYQDIAWLPKGTYILEVDGWCRIGNNEANWDEWTADHNASLASLYAQTEDGTVFSSPLANVMKGEYTDGSYDGSDEFKKTVDEVETIYYLPNSLLGGRTLIDLCAPAYTNRTIVKMEKDGKLRIGVKKEQQLSNSWVVIDDFRLFYCGTESQLQPSLDAIRDITSAKVVRTELFTIDGRRATNSQRGLIIVKQTLDNGTVVVRKVRK